MKKVDNFWVDENNNRWSCDVFTKELAEQLSKTLIDCSGCINCSDCSNCSDCRDCRNCINCSDCSGCRDCSYCSNCRNFKSNPERYVSYKVGSRNDNTVFYYYDKKIYVLCGCFKGNLGEFELKVKETYKEDEKHYKDYMKLVEKVKKIFE